LNYYRRYVGDYLKDTSRLSLLEHGAYTMLLDHYYAEEQPMPLDRQEIYTMVRAMTPADKKAVDKVLARYFFREGDGYHNARADHEIEVSRKARDNGGKGGRPRTGRETEQETEQKTGQVTELGGRSGHPPTTNHQSPATNLRTTTRHDSAGGPAAGEAGVAVWNAYAAAFQRRYNVPPVRNAKVNSQIKQLVARIPAAEAPEVAEFYLQHSMATYIRATHSIGLLLRDCEGLHAQWKQGRATTDTAARQADQTAARGGAVHDLLREKKAVGG
jgi:uncharacterized protein YdaU (DUF1376 family)